MLDKVKNNSLALATLAVLVAGTALLLGWDIFVAIEPTPGDTISELLAGFSTRYWSLPLMYFGLGAHIFIPKKGGTEWSRTIALWVMWAVCIGVNVATAWYLPWWITVPFGTYLGWSFWGQAKKEEGKTPPLPSPRRTGPAAE